LPHLPVIYGAAGFEVPTKYLIMQSEEYLSNHQSAQEAGQFSPYYKTNMNPSIHCQPIVTNARSGKPLSVLNRRRVKCPERCIVIACLVFWATVAFVFYRF
jgi:hypothetical protein